MRIKIKLFASLRAGRFDSADRDFPAGSAVRDALREIAVPEKEAHIIFVNGRHAEPGAVLKEGDTLAVFPLIGGG
jgi:molybdopterin converting factor small subunit